MDKKLERLLKPGKGIYFFILFCFCALSFLTGYVWLGVGELAVALLTLAFYLVERRARTRNLEQYLQSDPDSLESVSKGEGPLPALMVRMEDGSVVWENYRFSKLTGGLKAMVDEKLEDVLPGASLEFLYNGKSEAPQDVTLDGRRYRVYGSILRGAGSRLGVLYLSDLTEMYQVRDEYIRSRPVIAIILIDNYEEMTQNLTEGAISKLNASLNEAITQWTEEYRGLLRRLERNRFLFIFEKRDLDRAKADKFSLLEKIHKIQSPSGLAASISIGLGVDGADFEEGYSFAALGIEMALSRGGDQAVIKDRFNFDFYGGRSKETEYRSKVRSRVTANSIMELIAQSDHVFIMGHRNADLDSLGAAVGINCLCRKKGKKASIVIDVNNNACPRLLDELRNVPEYRDVFISGQDALLDCDNKSILIVVDTNRPDQVEFQPLLEAISKVCVVDHHRRAADYINPVVVNLHETYASSASELVTELVSYAVESRDVLPIEAKSLMAGICLDTKFFNVRTGERTFEAAAVLRRMGADTTEVKLLLQNDFHDTLEKYQIIKEAKLYRDDLAIAALEQTTNRILAAQAADELLNISGITASFVLYPDGDVTIISARSIGTANVQMILEPLGGGGNAATAGAQMQGVSVKDALDKLIASIDAFYEE